MQTFPDLKNYPSYCLFLTFFSVTSSSTNINIIRNSCKSSGLFFLVSNNIRMDASPNRTFFVAHDRECIAHCMDFKNCKSLNLIQAEHWLTCLLFDKDQHTENVSFLIQSNSRYYDTGHYSDKIGHHCRNMGNNPCLYRQCMDSCNPPYYSCHNYEGLSCQGIQHTHPNISLKTGVYILTSIMEDHKLGVMCDMEVSEGGWLVIGRVLKSPTKTDFADRLGKTWIGWLEHFRENYILHPQAIKLLQEKMGFKQIRIYCKNTGSGKTFHIITQKNQAGFSVVDYISLRSDVPPKACKSFHAMEDDNSSLSQVCESWGSKGTWSAKKLYQFPIKTRNKRAVGFGDEKAFCDSSETIPNGMWYYFVR